MQRIGRRSLAWNSQMPQITDENKDATLRGSKRLQTKKTLGGRGLDSLKK